MINVGNPIIFINASDIGLCGDENTLEIDKLDILENIRCVGGVKMGLGKDINDMKNRPATPKISFLNKPIDYLTSS